MRHGSLFSGIGGFDLAAEWMGWENVFHCEWNKFGQQVLKYYWPKAISYEDITKTDFTIHRGTIDILSGGFPCQPYSSAGKRLGKEDERHLWPEMLRAIREIQPSWVVGENVFGLVNWSDGLVFHEVQTDLEAEGYEVQSYVLPAASVNAPHRRDRIWFVAYNKTNRQSQSEAINKWEKYKQDNRDRIWDSFNTNGSIGDASDSNGKMLEYWDREGKTIIPTDQEIRTKSFNCSRKWESFPTVSPLCNGDDGLSNRLDSITFPKWRQESIKAGGNAIVPQVVHQIFKAIEEYESLINSNLTAETAVKP
jgi:DNA (cytosine-5)-methyltransferase 1